MQVRLIVLVCVAACLTQALVFVSSVKYEDFNPELAESLLMLAEHGTEVMRKSIYVNKDVKEMFREQGKDYPVRAFYRTKPPPEFGSLVRVTLIANHDATNSITVVFTDQASDQMRWEDVVLFGFSKHGTPPLETRMCKADRQAWDVLTKPPQATQPSVWNATEHGGDCNTFDLHPAFKALFKTLFADTDNNLKGMMLNYTGPVFVTGFSMGGGLAALYGYHLHKQFNTKTVVTYTFSQPMIGDKKFADAVLASHMILFRAVGKVDISPYLPPPCGASIAYAQAGTLVMYDRDIPNRFAYAKVCKPQKLAECADQQQPLVREVTNWCHLDKNWFMAHLPSRAKNSKGSGSSSTHDHTDAQLQNNTPEENRVE